VETASTQTQVRQFSPDVRAAESIEREIAQRSAAGASAAGSIPDFFVLGHPKSGTTALYDMLAQHPQIHVGGKEPAFFSTELRIRDTPAETPKTLSDYATWFGAARPEQLVGDVSVSYLWSQQAPSLIAKAQPEARVIALLREPSQFLHSMHMQWLQDYIEVETDLRRALELEQPRREGRELSEETYWPRVLLYSDFTHYVEQLQRYRELFPPERIMVLIYDDFRADNASTLRRVLRFLDVDEEIQLEPAHSNGSVQVGSPRMHALLRSLIVADHPASRAVNRSLKALTPTSMRQDALRRVRDRFVYRAPVPPEQDVMIELRRRYKPEVQALSEYLQRDLVALWGYDTVD
jgi:hypothetical protein